MKLKAIMWFIFSGTATLCAFFLPGFFWTSIISAKYGYNNVPETYPMNVIFICFLILLMFGAIFHSLYRIPVFITDLGFSKTAVLISKIICSAIFIGIISFFIWIISEISKNAAIGLG